MASSEYIAAAKKETREPVVLLQIEDAEAETTFYTTQSDWAGSTTLTDISTSEVPGSVIQELTDETETWVAGAGDFSDRIKWVASFNQHVDTITLQFVKVAAVPPTSAKFFIYTDSGGTIGTQIAESSTENPTFTNIGSYKGFNGYRATETFTFNDSTVLSSGSTYWVVGEGIFDDIENAPSVNRINVFKPAGTVVTSTIDLGAVPTSQPTLNIDDIEEANSAITYTAVGGNTDPPATSIGTVADGDSLTAYQYYRITANFASTGGRSQLSEISLTEGLFRYYGTHIDSPFQGINPYIIKDSVSSLKGEIKLDKGTATIGEISLKLVLTPETNDLISTGFLKGKDVQVTSGFVGLDTESYEPIITGSIQDVSLDPNKSEATLKIRAILKQFEKRKLPNVTYNASGVNQGTDITYAGDNVATVIKDIYDTVGIRDRYVHPDYDTLETQWTAESPTYDVWRTLNADKPIEAWKLLDELAQTAGIWLVPLGNGQIKPKVYDVNEPGTVTLDANEMKYSKLDLLFKDFNTRFLAYYNDTTSANNDSPAGTNAEDFDNAKYRFDATAEILFSPEKGQKDFFDQWRVGRAALGTALTAPPDALEDLTTRWNGWYSDPLYMFEAKDMPPRYAGIDPGDVVTINNLPLPVPNSEWDSGTTYSAGDIESYNGLVYKSLLDSNTNNNPSTSTVYWVDVRLAYEDLIEGREGYSQDMPFLVMSKTFNPNKAVIDFKFMQMPIPHDIYYADSYVANTGTITGNLSDTQAIDGVYFQINEVTGTPGFSVDFTFIDVHRPPAEIEIFGRYEGNPAHNVKLQIYNATTTTWDNVTADSNDFPDSTTNANFEFDITGTLSDYVSVANETKLRIIHTSPGSASHDMYIDLLKIVSN